MQNKQNLVTSFPWQRMIPHHDFDETLKKFAFNRKIQYLLKKKKKDTASSFFSSENTLVLNLMRS